MPRIDPQPIGVTPQQRDALVAANAPSAINPLVTDADLSPVVADVSALEALAPESFIVPSDGTYQTVGAVLVAIPTGFTPTNGRRYKYEATVWAKNAAGDLFDAIVAGVVTRIGGASALGLAQATVASDATDVALAAATVVVALAGNEVSIDATGVALETLDWGVRLDVTGLPDV